MGIISDIFLADNDEKAISFIGENYSSIDKVELKNLTPLELSMLWAILLDDDNNEELTFSLFDEFRSLIEEEEESIYIVPLEFINALLNIEESQIDVVAEKWSKKEEMEPHVIFSQEGTIKEIIISLINLAQRAEATSTKMYLFNSL
ncbi:MAG: hypothetical protein ACFFAS_12195 [Promethearchaeota archaeon]